MSDASYTVRWKGVQSGPYTLEQILRMLDEGKVSMSHEVMIDGKWQTLDELVSARIPPPLPPPSAGQEEGGLVPAPEHSAPDPARSEVAAQSRGKPTCVVVLGILNIVFASFALITLPAVVFILLPFIDQMPVAYGLWLAVALMLDALFKLSLLIFGIALLKEAPWARQACAIYGWGAIGLSLTDFVAALVFSTIARPVYGDSVYSFFVALRLISPLFGVVYPIILIAFMRKSKVVRYFAALK